MAERFINIAFPFEDDTKNNYFLKMNKEGKRAIKSDLIHLLLTTPGDRLYLPEFGADLRKFLFEPMMLKHKELLELKYNKLSTSTYQT